MALDDDDHFSINEQTISAYFVFFSALLAFTLVLSKLLHDNARLSALLPEAGMIILVGMLAGVLVHSFYDPEDQQFMNRDDYNDDNSNKDDDKVNYSLVRSNLLSFSPNVFFVALLPPIIFNSGYHIRKELFFRHFAPITLFAVLGTLVSAIAIAFILFVVDRMGWDGNEFRPKVTELLTFGALISATDPVSTLAVFQSKRVDPQLFYLVFGESVLNDAVGLILFETFANFVIKDNGAGKVAVGMLDFVIGFVMDCLASPTLGVLFALASALLFKHVDMRQHRIMELSLYILIMYTPFLLADMLQLSGIVTILFTGIAARHYVEPNLSPATQANADTLFRLAAHLAETSIFLELGLSVLGLMRKSFSWRFILWSIVACLIGRALNVYPIAFFYNKSLTRDYIDDWEDPEALRQQNEQQQQRQRQQQNQQMMIRNKELSEHLQFCAQISPTTSEYTMTPFLRRDLKIHSKTAHMLWFSGLRGAVAYACVRSFPDTFGHTDEFVSITMAIVLLTVFCMGGATEMVLNFLQIEMNVDEDQYSKEWTANQVPGGLMSNLDKEYIQRFVLREKEHDTGEKNKTRGEDDNSSSADPLKECQFSIEISQSFHMENLERMGYRRKQSLFDFGYE